MYELVELDLSSNAKNQMPILLASDLILIRLQQFYFLISNMKNINLYIILILVCFASCTHKNNNGRFNGALEEMGYPMQADSVNLI